MIASAPECELVAVATRSAERRALVATEHPDAAVVDDLAGLAAAGAEAVTVSTPADTHIPLCRQALGRGLPVVVDKPFALTAADARPAVELAERLGLALSVYQNRRWDSDFRTVARAGRSGILGEITRFESRFERRQDGPPAAGGGTLLDFGSHLVDQAIQLLGPVRTVYAEIHHRDDPAGLDDDVFVALTHARGAHSHLWGSWVQFAPGPRFRVTGTRATYVVDGLDIQEELLAAGRTAAPCPLLVTATPRWPQPQIPCPASTSAAESGTGCHAEVGVPARRREQRRRGQGELARSRSAGPPLLDSDRIR